MAKNNNDKQNLSKNLKKELSELFDNLNHEKEEETLESNEAEVFITRSNNKYKSKLSFDPFSYPEIDPKDGTIYSLESAKDLLERNANEFRKHFDKQILDQDTIWSDDEFGNILSLYLSRCWFKGLVSYLTKDKKFELLDITPVVCVYPSLKKIGLTTLLDVRVIFDESLDYLHDSISFGDDTILKYSEVMQSAVPSVYYSEWEKYCNDFYKVLPVLEDIEWYLPGEVVYMKEDRENVINKLKTLLKTEKIYK